MTLFVYGILGSFLLGLIFGSFANVCIYRLPLELSIIKPRSSCVQCKNPIFSHDNIPVLSFIILGGKCRHCKAKISFMYPFVEIITGALFALLFYKYQFSLQFFLFCAMTFLLVIVSGIDKKYHIIPDIFPLILASLGLLFAVFNTTLGNDYLERVINSVCGLVAGGGVLFLIGMLGQFMYKKEAMGGGDVKLMAGIGAIIGWDKALLAIFIAAVLGSIVGIFLLIFEKMERRGYMPFGPFLSAASFIVLFLPKPGEIVNAFFLLETNILYRLAGY
ncbi:MAG: prepilin peptidase [Endomicrobia bacterium]|nr:prepilin peptidase [Endomicrobiia bacterium]MCL2506723.1 prepilin peptidase [Endomicrobiia bacterium]